MAKSERPLTVEIPAPAADQPVWSRVGIIGVVGFVVGMAWPRIAGVKIGPAVPADLRAQVEGSASPAHHPPASASGAAPSPTASGSSAGPAPDADPDAAPAPNQEMVVIGPGKITRCSDKKDEKIEDCEKLLIDPIMVKRLRELARCPSALGLNGKVTIGFEVDFAKLEVGVKRRKKGTSLPSSTVGGIVACAAHDFGNVSLAEVPHKHRRYTLEYALTFYGPGKHPEAVPTPDGGDAEPAAGSTTSADDATGTAVVAWDTALLRKEPKDGEVVARLVRGTKVKIAGKQGDWYKIESGSKTGWVYRGTIGL